MIVYFPSFAMKYVVTIPPRKKWEVTKRINLEYYIANINANVGFNARQEGLSTIFNLISLLTWVY